VSYCTPFSLDRVANMETIKFLQSALGYEGFYCVFAVRKTDDRRVQKFYLNLDQVVHAANNFNSEGYDAYYALATFTEDNSRKIDNAHQMRSFFLDLDCGSSKGFTDQEAAYKALRTFCKNNKLPRPLLINSGRGIHVYWRLTHPVSKGDWLPVAERLKSLCARNNFPADPAVTSDVARVLRVPLTHNYKGNPPILVEILGDTPDPVDFDLFAEALGSDPIPVPRRYAPSDRSALNDVLMGNRTSSFKTIIDRTLAGSGCGQIAYILNNRATLDEPMWRGGLSIAKFCSDGEKAAHFISKGHPDYSEAATENKLDLIKGPYRCETFDKNNSGICARCPHMGNIGSPISLGGHIQEATEADNVVVAPSASLPNAPIQTYIIPKYPAPYFRGANGGVYLRKVDDDGEIEERCIYHNDIYVIRRVLDQEIGASIVMRLHLPLDGVKDFTVALSAVTSKEEFRKAMSMQGVAVARIDELMKYTLDWVNQMQLTEKEDMAHKQFGWADEEFDSFILGNQQIYADRIDFNPPSGATRGLFSAFEAKGTLDGWKNAVEFYNRAGFELHQYMVANGFGSILMPMSPVHCSHIHLYSKESGVGKTTAMMASASIWGSPSILLLNERDTQNSKMNRGEVYKNLPLYFDELTNSSPRDLSNLAYQLTGGKQRGRMSSGSNNERFRGEPWSLTSISTGNTSAIERISGFKDMPKAEAQRILEIKVDRLFVKAADKEEQDKFSKAIVSNYGHAGVIFVQHVMKNVDSTRTLFEKVQKRVDEENGLTSENRFWSAGAAATLTALIIARKIGLLNYDPEQVFKFISNEIQKNKRISAEMTGSAEEYINDYIHENYGNILWIKSTDDLRAINGNGIDELIVPEQQPRGKLVARYETDVKRLYLAPKPFKHWCTEQQINYASLMTDLAECMNARKAKMRLGKGTHMNLPPSNVLVLDCKNLNVVSNADTED
jgi:hypothetical protein